MVHLKVRNLLCAQSVWEILVDLNGVVDSLNDQRDYGLVVALIWGSDVEYQREKKHWARD